MVRQSFRARRSPRGHKASISGETEAQRRTVACSRGHSRGRTRSSWAVFSPACYENGSQAEHQTGLSFYRSGAHKVSNSQTWSTDSRVCPVIAKVIATFSIVFQNEANLNSPFRKNIFFYIEGWEWEGGDSDRMATQAFAEEAEFKSPQRGPSLGVEGGPLGSHTGERLQFCRDRHLLSGFSAKLKGSNCL